MLYIAEELLERPQRENAAAVRMATTARPPRWWQVPYLDWYRRKQPQLRAGLDIRVELHDHVVHVAPPAAEQQLLRPALLLDVVDPLCTTRIVPPFYERLRGQTKQFDDPIR